VPHFTVEEHFIFPILGNQHELVQQALSDHHEIHRILRFEKDPVANLELLEKVLEQHIRFEERVLFAEIQKIATAKQMAIIAENHSESNFIENTTDEFWNQK
jgi:iron-sulfur cluster repair protein YtfE (RIC family)